MLATKYNMSIEDMTQICKAPLDFTTYVMREKPDWDEGYFPSVRIQGFGVFYCTEGRSRFFKKLNEKRKFKQIQSGGIQSTDGDDATSTIQDSGNINREG